MFFNTIGTAATIIQKVAIGKLRNNVAFNPGMLAVELSLLACGVILLFRLYDDSNLNVISEVCKPHVKLTNEEWAIVDKMYTLENPQDGQMSYHIIISAIVLQATTICMVMLQKTQTLGSLITMLYHMTNELFRFAATFCLIFLAFLMAGRYLGNKILPDQLQCIKYLIVNERLPASFKFSGIPTPELCNVNLGQQIANLAAQSQQFLTDMVSWKLSYD